jgi:phenylalanyl-tRNA synthetase beta chain
VAKAFELQGAAYLFEMDMVKLGKHIALRRYHPLPRYPEVIRDIALVVDAGLASREVRNLIESFPLVSQVSLFDLYVGEQIPAGKKSLAYRIVYQSPSHTLTDEEVEKIQRKIVERLRREFGAALRT